MRPVRILHAICSMGGGGAERQLCYLCAEQVRAGFEVHVVLVSGGVYLARLQAAGATIHWLGTRIAYDPRAPGRFRALCRQLRPDIVQAWMMPLDIYCGWVCPRLGIPWIVNERSHGPWQADKFGWKPIGYGASWLRIRSARSAAAIIANSDKGRREWSRWARTSVSVIGNALSLAEIAATPSLPLPDTLWPAGTLRILCAGRLVPLKNWELTIRFLARVVPAVPASVCICGDGPLAARLQAQIDRLGLANRIRLLGFREDLWQLMKAADVFVSLSRIEGSPNVVLEAAACGCALVVSDIPQHREWLDETQACFVGLDNPLAAVDDPVFTSADARLARAQAARSAVSSHSLAAMAAAYADQYQAILRGRRP